MRKFVVICIVIFLCFTLSAGTVLAQSITFNVGQPNSSLFYGSVMGFGAELDPVLFSSNNLNRGVTEADWTLNTQKLKDLNVGIIRLMMQLNWATSDPNLMNWNYNSQQMKSVFKYLDFACQNNITVILTDWGWSVRNSLYANPTDPRFGQGIAMYLDEFINKRGYSCIKYLIVGNEPDNEIELQYGMDAYETMYRNVDAALKAKGIRNLVKLTGPDMGGQWSFMGDAVSRLKDILDTYDFHRYASTSETSNFGLPGTWESLWSHLDMWRGDVNYRDSNASGKQLLLTEMGNDGGTTNSHPLIDTFEYALHMADYGTTLLITRINTGIAWTMHDVYYFDGGQFMEWGMWRYKNNNWSIRPWGQSFGLLIKHAPRGSIQAPINGTPTQTPALSQYHAAAVKRPDGKWSIFLVNRTTSSVTMTVNLPTAPQSNFDRYVFDRNTSAAFPNQLVLPPVGTVSNASQLILTVSGESFMVLAEQITTPSPCPSATHDVNGDCRVNGADVVVLITNWLRGNCTQMNCDLTGDGKINVFDFGTIAADLIN